METENYGYDQRPRALDEDPRYKMLSSESKELYTLLLARRRISEMNVKDFRDAHGIFVKLKIEGACKLLNCAREKAMKVFSELEKVGLITRRRVGYSQSYRIYVKDLLPTLSKLDKKGDENSIDKYNKKPTNRCSKNSTDISSENQTYDVGKSDPNYIKLNFIDSKNHNINERAAVIKDYLMDNINFDLLAQEFSEELLSKVVGVMTTTCLSDEDPIIISKRPYRRSEVERQIYSLDEMHIRYICQQLLETKTKIYNLDSYILCLLLNAKVSMEINDLAMFNRDELA